MFIHRKPNKSSNFSVQVFSKLNGSISWRSLWGTSSEDRKDQESFRQQTQVFLDLIVQQDRLLSVRKEFSVLPWLAAARS